MKSNRELLAYLTNGVASLDALLDRLSRNRKDILDVIKEFQMEIIKEEQLLAGKWDFSYTTDYEVSFRALYPEAFEGLVTLLNSESLSSVYLKGATLYFESYDIHLTVSRKDVTDFVRDHGMQISATALTKEKAKLFAKIRDTNKLISFMRSVQ